MVSPLDGILERQPFAVLDGGLATELERRGADLHDPLWSARILVDQPDLIRAVHLEYFRAGADVVTTASYQASMPGLAARGLSARAAETVLRRSVALAVEARSQFLEREEAEHRPRPLIAASIGSYGAFLHDGSEYRGDYGLTSRELFRFHRDRFEILADTEADLIACETIPSRREADVLVDLFERRGGRPGWISFTCRDERRIAEGDAFAESVTSLSASAWVVLVGINCTAPELVEPLLESARDGNPKPFVVYPNSGETYQARTGTWIGVARSNQVGARNAERWHALGARLIGGCCRTGPDNVREIRGVFDSGAREARDDAR